MGSLKKPNFHNENYPKPIAVRMYLPPGYDPQRPEPYPLLIMLHGQNADGGQWQRLGLTDAADHLIRSGAIAPLVIAMPEEFYTLQYYTDTTYGQVLVDELLPWLQQQYPVCRNRECVAIGGLSRGAAWAARLAFTHWESFGAIGLHSLPTTLSTLPQWVNAIPEGSMPRIYMDIGKQDIGFKEAERFEILLQNLSIPHEWIVQPGEHTEKYWSAHVTEYLRWYNSVWAE